MTRDDLGHLVRSAFVQDGAELYRDDRLSTPSVAWESIDEVTRELYRRAGEHVRAAIVQEIGGDRPVLFLPPWTDDPPKESGNYWFRSSVNKNHKFITEVEFGPSGLPVSQYWGNMDRPGVQCSGPIPFPPEPEST